MDASPSSTVATDSAGPTRRGKERPPGPPRAVAAFAAIAFSGARLQFLTRCTKAYGDVVYFKLPGLPPYCILNHPDYVRDVLVTRNAMFHKGLGLQRAKRLLGEGLLTSEDEFHARQRRLILPAFHREAIARYATTMVDYAQRRSDGWSSGATFDVSKEMAAIALAIAARTLFDADMERDASTIGTAVSDALSTFNLGLTAFGNRLLRTPIVPAARRFRRAKERLDETVYRLIAERRATGHTGHDVLSMLVAARDVDGDNTGMSDEQIRDEVLTLLLAGHETTANSLTWTWYLLSQNPGAEQRLHAELDQVLAGRAPTAADVEHLKFTRAVLSESMRLYPPAYVVGRRALEPYPVPGTGYVLPAGTVVLMSQFLLHRDPRFWDEPERFVPERWMRTDSRSERHRYAYFPFGAGPRLCIGEHFAWMEGTLVLAAIAQQWRLQLVPGHPVAPQPIITLRAKHGMRMTISSRSPRTARPYPMSQGTASGHPAA